MRRKASLLSALMAAQRKRLVILAILSLGLGAALITQAVLLAEVVQRVFVEGDTLGGVTAALGYLLLVMAIRVLLIYASGRTGLSMAATAKQIMRSRLLARLTGSSLAGALAGQAGGKISVALDAVDESDSYFSQYMPKMIEALFIPVLLLISLFILHPNSGLIVLFTAPFIPLFMVLVGLSTKRKSEEKYEQLAQFSGIFLDSLQGLVSLKLFGWTKRQEERIERSSLNYRDATMGILRIAFTNTFMLEAIVMMGIGVVALELALQLVVFKTLTFHTALLVLLLAPEFYNLLKNTGTAFHSGRTSMGAIRKVEEMLETVEDDPQHETSDAMDALARKQLEQQLAERPPVIELQDVCFEYEHFKLNTGRLTIHPGEQIAVVGRSGSGKTTLLHLLSGLLTPASGEVVIQHQSLALLGEELWFRHIGYITQHPYIFAGTFADNIALGAGRAVSRAEIVAATDAAGLTELVSELEHDYDTEIGDGGRGLSGGERQRLALARAFLKQPSVLLFDEPTVGLDVQTEKILQRSISELARKATVITVAHRLYTIRHADRILYMEKGQVADSGTHEELLTRLPQYAELVTAQREGGLSSRS